VNMNSSVAIWVDRTARLSNRRVINESRGHDAQVGAVTHHSLLQGRRFKQPGGADDCFAVNSQIVTGHRTNITSEAQLDLDTWPVRTVMALQCARQRAEETAQDPDGRDIGGRNKQDPITAIFAVTPFPQFTQSRPRHLQQRFPDNQTVVVVADARTESHYIGQHDRAILSVECMRLPYERPRSGGWRRVTRRQRQICPTWCSPVHWYGPFYRGGAGAAGRERRRFLGQALVDLSLDNAEHIRVSAEEGREVICPHDKALNCLQRDHRGGSDTYLQRSAFTNQLAGPALSEDAFPAVVPDRNSCPAAEDHDHVVGRFTLTH
jgi:hypothetical protein